MFFSENYFRWILFATFEYINMPYTILATLSLTCDLTVSDQWKQVEQSIEGDVTLNAIVAESDLGEVIDRCGVWEAVN